MPEHDLRAELLERLHGRNASVAVVGLGYVGLPLAVAVAGAGHRVVGIDVFPPRVDDVNSGIPTVADVDPVELSNLVGRGQIRATKDFQEAASVDVAVIAVPTPIDEHNVPILDAVRAASDSLASVMRPGSLVILESTTYPGTTEEIVVPSFTSRGLRPGDTIFIGYSPERIDPSNKVWSLTNTPKIVAGLTPQCLELVTAFYGSFVGTVVPVSDLKTAEITKLFENIFRVVNIALANELQVICDAFEIDVWEVIGACSTKPFGFMPFYPGPGLGGHCVPVDPFFLAYKARQKGVSAEFIELAGRVNAAMPEYVVNKVVRLLNSRRRALAGARIGLLGVAYKRNTSDVREAPAIKVVELLKAAGAAVSYHDPHVPELAAAGLLLRSEPELGRFLGTQDCVLVLTDHDSTDWSLVKEHSNDVIDTRNAIGRWSSEQAN